MNSRSNAAATPPPAQKQGLSHGWWNRCCGFGRFITRHGWLPLASLLLAGIGLWGFLELADEVQEQETQSFDEQLFRWVAGNYQELGGFWQEAGRDVTALGGSTIITLITVSVTLFLLLRRQWKSALFVVTAVLGGLLISLLLKELFDRARPDVFEHGSHTMTSSFPSGHSMNAAVAYLAMGILLAKLVESPRMKGYVIAVALLIPLLVGFSRVALAVHWPTDVVAGWLVGLAWALLVWAVATFLQRRGGIEPEGAIQEPIDAEEQGSSQPASHSQAKSYAADEHADEHLAGA